MKTWITSSFLVILILTGTVTTNAKAADDFNTWQNTLAPLYLWGVSLDGSLNGQGLQLDFSEAVSDLNGIFTLHYEGAKGNWGIIADYSFLNLKPEGTLPTSPGTPVTIDMENTIAEVAGLYRFGPNNPWQLLAGVRRYDLDVDVNVGMAAWVSVSMACAIAMAVAWTSSGLGGGGAAPPQELSSRPINRMNGMKRFM